MPVPAARARSRIEFAIRPASNSMNRESGHVFISYARKDRDLVSVLAALLEQEGWSVWWDRENLPAGQRFHRVIDAAIKDACLVLVCWSEASIDSDWVIDEASEAKQQGKLMPVLLEDVKPPYGFRGYHYVDLSQWNRQRVHESFRRLLRELENLGIPGTEASPPEVDVETLLERLDSANLAPEERLAAGDRLSEIGDPRPGVGLSDRGIPDIDWVDIPGGEFRFGEKNSICELAGFRIARYPITNSQFQAFIDDDGPADDSWWEDLPRASLSSGNPSWRAGNRPRVFVSWYEAVAYCRWLSYKHGCLISLPREQQWERAARGTDGLEYPWGDAYQSGYANVDERYNRDGLHQLNQPSTVGMYPSGASCEGVMDLAGNVCEWMLNEYSNPDLIAEEGKARRALRGGAWNRNPSFARATLRLGYLPYRRYGNIGFRVVTER